MRTILIAMLLLPGACGGSRPHAEEVAAAPRCVRAPGGCAVFVTGEVQHPGRFVYRQGTTVVGALRAAGGFTAQAHRNGVLVIRGVQRYRVRVIDVARGVGSDLLLAPGDVVLVPEDEVLPPQAASSPSAASS